MYEKMRTNNMDMNKLIQDRKEFRNPSIYEKLIQYCDIDELGTNYPPELYDPMQWRGERLPEHFMHTFGLATRVAFQLFADFLHSEQISELLLLANRVAIFGCFGSNPAYRSLDHSAYDVMYLITFIGHSCS